MILVPLQWERIFPPFTFEICFRTVFISSIEAPDFKRSELSACLSARLIPSAGSQSKEEPPPERRTTTKSSEVRLEHCSRTAFAAFTEF